MRFQSRCDLVFVSVALELLAVCEMVEHYFLRRVTLARKFARVIIGVLGLLSLVPIFGAKISSFDVYDFALAPAGTLVLVACIAVCVWGVVKGQREFAPVFAIGLVATGFAALNDILTDLNVLHNPALYSYTLTGLPISATAVMFADFLGLHQRNKELTVSLNSTNQELAGALAKAQESTRLKSEFLATVSHELRTPLNAIINIPDGLAADFREHEVACCEKCGAQAVLEAGDEIAAGTPCPACGAFGTLTVGQDRLYEGDAEETLRYLNSIKRSGKHLLSIVSDILDLSKLEVGRMVLHRESLTVDGLIDELRGATEPLAAQNDITLVFPPEGSADVLMRVDPVKLSQVFINLLGNAIKFSPKGGSIELEVTHTEDACLFSVADHGIGIAPENHQLIFERFRQVDASHTRSFGGTGLGLAIAKDLVVLHGGEIWVESELGKGAKFFVRLPLSEKAAAEEAVAVVAAPARDPDARTILVIDDDPMVVETVRLGLRGIKANIVSVGDPRQAGALIDSLEPDLVILDIMMPRVSGLSILKDLKRDPKHKDIPVVVASAYEANREVVSALGATWMDKPWDAKMLTKLVQPVVGGNPPKAGST